MNQEFATALHVLVLLSTTDELLPSEVIAGSVRTNGTTIRRLARTLASAGLVSAARGAVGGLRLARPADEITLADIYAALDPAPLIARRTERGNPSCPVGCKMDALVDALSREAGDCVVDLLASKTLAQFARQRSASTR